MPKVNGVVLDGATGDTLPGAHVYVDGTTIGTATDINGAFSLDIPEGSALTVSFVGYRTLQFVPVGSDALLVHLEPGVGLDEFEVVADRPSSLAGALLAALALVAVLLSEDDTPGR